MADEDQPPEWESTFFQLPPRERAATYIARYISHADLIPADEATVTDAVRTWQANREALRDERKRADG